MSFSYDGIAETKPLQFAVHPYKSAEKLTKAFSPLIKHLSKELGRPVHLSISKDYESHIQRIGNNHVDVAYMGPASYVNMGERYGKKNILARQTINGQPTFQGKIITRSDSNINNLSDLNNKLFAFGDLNSTMSHLVPHYMLIKAGITDDKLKAFRFLGSHDNVAIAVLAGDYHAGAVKEAIYNKYKHQGIKAIATTPSLYEHLIIASSTLDNQICSDIRNILLNLKNTLKGKRIMQQIKEGIDTFEPANDSDYDNLREIIQTLKLHKVI